MSFVISSLVRVVDWGRRIWWLAACTPAPLVVGCALAAYAFWQYRRGGTGGSGRRRFIRSAVHLLPQFAHRVYYHAASRDNTDVRIVPTDQKCAADNTTRAADSIRAEKPRNSDASDQHPVRTTEEVPAGEALPLEGGSGEKSAVADAGPPPAFSRISSEDPVVDPRMPRIYRPAPIGQRPARATAHWPESGPPKPVPPVPVAVEPSGSFSLFMSNGF
ncbi:hypothetical protein LPJ63_003957 [Coemansia sp. RSA 2711]|nr:hypothetical protein LPJ63_003957 [Coemansia sp. RSA 2711]KAJ2312437.1 hypothetical protein IWW54_002086 [Coemansia sp. RSA 2705]KAJ2389346.1 hypothetical protein H4S02_002408 [Coemansia sp. RSA 2611]